MVRRAAMLQPMGRAPVVNSGPQDASRWRRAMRLRCQWAESTTAFNMKGGNVRRWLYQEPIG